MGNPNTAKQGAVSDDGKSSVAGAKSETALDLSDSDAANLFSSFGDEPADEESTADESEVDSDIEEQDEDADGQLLSESEEEEEDDEDAEGNDEEADKKGLNKKLYEAREAKRNLKAQLKEVQDKLAEREAKLAEITQTSELPSNFTVAMQEVKSEEKLKEVVDLIKRDLEFYEDNEDGFTDKINGEEIERDRAYVRQQMRWLRKELERAAEVKEAIVKTNAKREETTKLAQARYKFVFDTKSPFHDTVLELAKEFPELNNLPSKSLILGRMALAVQAEKGNFTLVKKGKQAPAAKADKKAPPSLPATRKQAPVRQNSDDVYARMRNGDESAAEEWAARLFA